MSNDIINTSGIFYRSFGDKFKIYKKQNNTNSGVIILCKQFSNEIDTTVTETNAILEKIESKELEVKEKAEALVNPEVLVLFAAPGSTMIATSKSYVGSLVELVGGKNIVEDNSASFTTYNKEDLAMLNPEKILVMVHALPEETKAALEKAYEMVQDTIDTYIKEAE